MFEGRGLAGCTRGARQVYIREMATVGTQLRTARERLNLTLRDVANATNIKSDHLRAIEEAR